MSQFSVMKRQLTTDSGDNRNLLRRFMSETQFHGFHMAMNAGSSVELVTWLTTIFICASLAVYQTVMLVSLYRSEPTMTVTTVTNDRKFVCRDTLICFTYLSELKIVSTDVDLMLSQLNETQLNQLRSGNVSKLTLSPPLVQLILTMLSNVAYQEFNTIVFKLPQSKVIWGQSAIGPNQTFSWKKNVAIHQVYNYFASRKLPFMLLMKSTASIVCQVMQVKAELINFNQITGQQTYTNLNICDASHFSQMHYLGFCMTADPSNEHLYFQFSLDSLIISANPQLLDEFFSSNSNENVNGMVMIDLFGTKLNNLKSYYINGPYMAKTMVTAEIFGHYRAHNSRRKPCRVGRNEAVKCRDFCYANYFANLCGCWPQTAWNLDPNGPRMCVENMNDSQMSPPYYIPDYNDCLTNRSLDTNLLTIECEAKCLDDCERTKYTTSAEPLNPTMVQHVQPIECFNCSTIMMLKMAFFQHPLVELMLAKSPASFIAEFGGLLGLWLGGSLIAFTHIFFFTAKIVRERLAKPKEAEADQIFI